ncbi:MAG: glutamate racemase [Myxococcota bacterium]|nr:glutamate racemase [Myxococcota bacterium]
MPDPRPIGVFDSGIGGLTVLSALVEELPGEDILYLGDTARVPYGTRSPETVLRYARRVSNDLWQRGIKALIIACNTASSHALEPLRAAGKEAGIPVFGVIEPGVQAATNATHNQHVGVLGTEATIRGQRYQDSLRAAGIEVQAIACPLFVALAEEGWASDPVAIAVASRYLDSLKGGPDTVILGCTHYPLLRDAIAEVLPGVNLVDSAHATARVVRSVLQDHALENARTSGGGTHFLVTDNVERFKRVGSQFLGRTPTPVELIDLDAPAGLFAEES